VALMNVTGNFVLPEDLVLTPVRALPPSVRDQLESEPDDFALTRPRSRTPSRVVDAGTVALLRQFREPKPIVEAVIAYSAVEKSDPEQTLDEAFPILQRLVNDGLLLAADSADGTAIRATRAPGDQLGPFRVIAVVQALDDSELYRAEHPDGRICAVKISRDGGSRLQAAIAREAAILDHIGGRCAPSLVDSGELDGRPYLATRWVEGIDLAQAAQSLRSRPDHDGLLELVARVFDAYAQLHDLSVVHGDVHPRNVLVSRGEEVRLLDFGFADSPKLPREHRPRVRGGVGYFFEPEFAAARLGHQRPPRASPAGEQYAVGAMAYLAITGSHYARFSPEKEVMRREIATEAQRPFIDLGLVPSPAVEAVLARGMAKSPAARFSSIGDLARAFRRAAEDDGRRRRHRATDALALSTSRAVEGVTDLAAGDPLPSLAPPTASVTYGAAGLAYGLLRLARWRSDAELLALARVWSEHALALTLAEGAFVNAQIGIDEHTIGPSSPYHKLSGVHWVRACVAQALADVVGFAEACHSFLLASGDLADNPDLTLGRAGSLVACTHLVELSRTVLYADATPLLTFGDALRDNLESELEGLDSMAEDQRIGYLGIAHGWSGILLALMRWREARALDAPDKLASRLDELAALADRDHGSARWPRQPRETIRHPSGYLPSWCNGTAGLVHLWLAAARVTGDAGYRALAEGAGSHCHAHPDVYPDLCCGLAGRAYALVALFRDTGDEFWLDMARDLALRALPRGGELLPPAENPGTAGALVSRYPLSLYKGTLGTVVAAAEISAPGTAALPLFEAERWQAAC
jgi:eukaryotic-like serine/threonine-protein kinase